MVDLNYPVSLLSESLRQIVRDILKIPKGLHVFLVKKWLCSCLLRERKMFPGGISVWIKILQQCLQFSVKIRNYFWTRILLVCAWTTLEHEFFSLTSESLHLWLVFPVGCRCFSICQLWWTGYMVTLKIWQCPAEGKKCVTCGMHALLSCMESAAVARPNPILFLLGDEYVGNSLLRDRGGRRPKFDRLWLAFHGNFVLRIQISTPAWQ